MAAVAATMAGVYLIMRMGGDVKAGLELSAFRVGDPVLALRSSRAGGPTPCASRPSAMPGALAQFPSPEPIGVGRHHRMSANERGYRGSAFALCPP
jgi:hypothetical protein